MQRVLMESELFGAQLHFRPETFDGDECFVLEVFTEVQNSWERTSKRMRTAKPPRQVASVSPQRTYFRRF